MDISTATPPSPDLLFYYAMTFLLGTLLVGLVTWGVNRYVATIKTMLTELQNSHNELRESNINLAKIVAVHEQQFKTTDLSLSKIERNSEDIMKEFNSTLQRIDTTFRMLMTDRTERDIKKGKS